MKVTRMRIDDRLIHGQIITAWLREAEGDVILVADDKAAKDETQKMLLSLATPKQVKLLVLSLEDAAEELAKGEQEGKALLLVRNAKSAYELFQKGFTIEVVNVGNISNSKSESGRKKLLAYIYPEEQDIHYLEKIDELGIRLDVRSVPSDRSIDGVELIRKYKEA